MPKSAPEGSTQGEKETCGEPRGVLPVERLRNNVEALKKLTAPAALPRVRLRAQNVLLALYLSDDASGTGFGSTLINEKAISYKFGT